MTSDDSTETPLRLVMTGPEKAAGYRPQRKVEDIRGIATVKRNLVELIDMIKKGEHPTGWLGGVLFYGPAGCGKVFSAEVIASELEAELFLFDVAAGWDRKTFEQTVRDAISTAGPRFVSLHFENVDSPATTELRTPALLEMLDEASRQGRVISTASAIYPWQAGTQLVQQGRLGRVLLVLPPDEPSRALFLLEGAQTLSQHISDADLDWVVAHTEGYTFTDLRNLLNVALRHAATEQKTELPRIDRSALRSARRDVPASTADWLSRAGHHAMMNENGGLYDDLLTYFQMRTHS